MSEFTVGGHVGMKVLSMNISFKLPDDFKGDLNDAILAMVEYRKNKDKSDRPEPQLSQSKACNDFTMADGWEKFLKALEE